MALVGTVAGWPEPVSALLRGDEYTPRTFEINRNYFINLTSYELSTVFQDRFQQATNAFMGVGGSMRSNDLYLFQQLRIKQPLNASFQFRAEYLRDRDFDGDFQRFELGLARRINDVLWIEWMGQPMPNKEAADIGIALALEGERLNARVQAVYPLFWYEDKNPDEAEILKDPLNLMLEVQYLVGRSWEVFGQGDIDFASEWVNPSQSFAFRFEKFQAEGGVRWHLCERSHLQIAAEAERSQQSRTGLQPDDPLAFELDRDYLSVQLEWFRQLPDQAHVRIGSRYVYFDEDQQHPFAELDSLHLERQDRILYAAGSWALRNRLHLHAMALVDWLSDRRLSADPDVFTDEDRWLARTTGSIVFTGDRYIVEGGAGLTIIDPRFGGGFVRMFMDF